MLHVVHEDIANKLGYEYSVKRRAGELFVRNDRGGGSYLCSILPEIHLEMMGNIMLDTAILDKSLFGCLETTYDAAINMKHVRENFLHLIESDDEEEKRWYREFPEDGLRELEAVLAAFNLLYRECTGRDLKVRRLR